MKGQSGRRTSPRHRSRHCSSSNLARRMTSSHPAQKGPEIRTGNMLNDIDVRFPSSSRPLTLRRLRSLRDTR